MKHDDRDDSRIDGRHDRPPSPEGLQRSDEQIHDDVCARLFAEGCHTEPSPDPSGRYG
jgi:hypothetical protein